MKKILFHFLPSNQTAVAKPPRKTTQVQFNSILIALPILIYFLFMIFAGTPEPPITQEVTAAEEIAQVLAITSAPSISPSPSPSPSVRPTTKPKPPIAKKPPEPPKPPEAPKSDSGQVLGRMIFVSPEGNDDRDGTNIGSALKSIQKALEKAQPGDKVELASGTYMQDLVTTKSGQKDRPIRISGPESAVIKGGGKDRIFEINHDFYELQGFTIDGLHGSDSSAGGYRDKLVYVLGKETKDGVNGLKILNMHIKNALGECIRMRYFAHENEIANNTISNCGRRDFKFNRGKKNGEGLYIGTAPEQTGDGKNPTADPDNSRNNWVHHNFFDTQGNECVDIKEGATDNIVEHNKCTGQKDTESAGLDSRGENNTFRFNEVFDNLGAGVRLGGDENHNGIQNNVYSNVIRGNKSGGIKVQRNPQAKVCGNTMSDNGDGNTVGSFSSAINPTSTCG